MRLKRAYLFMLFVVMFVAFANVSEVKAMNSGFSTETLSEEEELWYDKNVRISKITSEPTQKTINCFDVNENGLIAICHDGTDDNMICVYTSEGRFLYGYQFQCDGTFGVEWNNEWINIYFVRSDDIITVDTDGNILAINKVEDTTDNNTYRNYLLHTSSRTVGDTTYVIRNDMGIFNWIATSYSQIVTIDANGAEYIIYDVSSEQRVRMIISFIVVAFLGITIVAIVIEYHKSKKKQEE